MKAKEYDLYCARLVGDLGLDPDLFRQVVLWALVEERIKFLTPPGDRLKRMRNAKDGKSVYWTWVETRTHRTWSANDILTYWERVCKDDLRHVRTPIRLEDRLRLFLTSPQTCKVCHRGPPEVSLELDHIEPVSRGGSGTFRNLQFLCSEHNRAKGGRLAREDFLARYLC